MRESKEKRKERILEAAFQIFLENGYTRAKMSEIAARAGYGKSTLYEYFTSKEEVFEQLLRYKFTDQYLRLSDAAEQAVDEQGQPCASAKIRTYLSGEIDLLLAYRAMNDLMPSAMMNPEFMTSPILCKVVKDALSYKYKTLSRWIAEGLANDEFHGVSPHVAAVSLIGAVSTLSRSLAITEFGMPTAEVKSDFFRFVFAGLGKA
jgi:TetR/AcrR family fatty acid metabolism transcriptional regulator